ncbi:hypothetical protein MJT46_005964 [Ovis ammon polii x Ovis aries]|nr:hypothetical protein MJT46_005964 [Ovis ammon polii x Ovis aries]
MHTELAVNEVIEASSVGKLIRKHIQIEQATANHWCYIQEFINPQPSASRTDCDLNLNSSGEIIIEFNPNLGAEGCVLVVSMIEQLTQVHNLTVQISMERLCSYLPAKTAKEMIYCIHVTFSHNSVQNHRSRSKGQKGPLRYKQEKLFLKTTCYLVVHIFGPDIVKLFRADMNADVVCHTLKFCKQDPGQPLCHLYPLPKSHKTGKCRNIKIKLDFGRAKSYMLENSHYRLQWNADNEAWTLTLEKARQIVKKSPALFYSTDRMLSSNWLSLSQVFDLGPGGHSAPDEKEAERATQNSVPFSDADSDKYSDFPTLRGFHWRGRDCNDSNKMAYPGRRPDNWDSYQDSNCNGIWGVDPKDGIPYEKKFCEGSQPRGVILLGDSAGAHFHIPPDWITASQMSLLSSASGNDDESESGSSCGMHTHIPTLIPVAVQHQPLSSPDGDNSRTGEGGLPGEQQSPGFSKKSFFNLPIALTNELDWPQLSGTTGFLYSTSRIKENSIYLRLRKRNRCNHRDYQNISKNGYSGKEATIPDLKELIKVSPCRSWMSSNKTLRTLTSERAEQLSKTLKKIATSQKFKNFDLFYLDFDFQERHQGSKDMVGYASNVTEEWQKKGGQPWQLIEPVDGFHPNENQVIGSTHIKGRGSYEDSKVVSQLLADRFWKKMQHQWPHVLGKENPFNPQIEEVFGDQGGH